MTRKNKKVYKPELDSFKFSNNLTPTEEIDSNNEPVDNLIKKTSLYIIDTFQVKLREEPSRIGKVLTILERGCIVEKLDNDSSDNEWILIRDCSTQLPGYVMKIYLKEVIT